MAVYKEEKTNTWRAVYRYTGWNGERKQTQKRGFKTKREAQALEREQLNKTSADLDMTFKSFVDLYTADMKTRLKENTWATKDHIIRTKLLPYFGRLKMCNITAQQIITWQNEMLNHKDENGKPYSPVYLKTVHNQLSAIFNHAVRYYNLRENPCKKAGSMGKKKNREMMFWTKEQYLKFAEVMMDKPLSFYAFEILYWCGIREGELLALTPADFDFEKRTVTINKSYQRLNGQDLITTPKTEKSNRVITMPQFLAEEIQDYIKILYGIGPDDRMFTVTKSYLHREMDRGAKEAGVPRIRIHDIRHSAVSLLIDMGFSATAIADRVGHESIDITYNYLALEDDESRLQRRMFRMFGVEGTSSLHFATNAKMIGGGLDEQLEKFVREHSDTKLIIVDTLQKVREAVSDSYSYSSDYEVIGKLKQFADRHGVCVLIVHHTRKQPAGDSFEMISGTTGLLGCADGALLMQKEKRTDNKATLEVVGRDQPDQRLFLCKDQENLIWNLDHAENELWKQLPDPVLEAVAKIVSADNREWEGSPTELVQAIQTDMAVNRLTKHLNVNASRLLEEHQVKYEYKIKHEGRRIRLIYMVVEAPAFEVIE